MAVYKVPQDVEADDKLIGPFSFRQFIYLIVVAISIAGAWGLSQVFIPLAIIPLPIIVFFAALALPLRKDQPMEAYLSAVVSFYFLKSRKRFWIPDGIDSFVTIIPPKDADRILTKGFDDVEATKRLGYLADLVDTHGWAIRGAGGTPDTSISTDLYYESQQTVDMMDGSTPQAQAMAQHLQKEAAGHRQDAIETMQTAKKAAPVATAQAPATVTVKSNTPPAPQATATIKTTPNAPAQPAQVPPPESNDAPPVSKLPPLEKIRAARMSNAAQQKAEKDSKDALALVNGLIEEAGEKKSTPAVKPVPEKPASTSVPTPDTATMVLTQKQAGDLSQQKDVSVETLAKEANRVAKKNEADNKILKDGDEVTISFH